MTLSEERAPDVAGDAVEVTVREAGQRPPAAPGRMSLVALVGYAVAWLAAALLLAGAVVAAVHLV